MRDGVEAVSGKLSVTRVETFTEMRAKQFTEVAVELLGQDNDSDDLDPHTATQLQNNESQYSQDSYGDNTELLAPPKQELALQVSPSK
jgi:hypothetical protein